MRFLILILLVSSVVAQNPKIKVGRTVSLVGIQAAEAVGIINGFKFGIDYINNNTGVIINGTRYDFQIITWNDASDTALVTRLYEDMINRDTVDILFGPWSTLLTGPALTVANKFGTPIVFAGASSTQFYTSGYNNSFGLLIQAGKRSLPCMDVFAQFRPRNFAIITTDDAFQQLSINLIKSQLTSRNVSLIYNITVPREALIFDDITKELNDIRPEILILGLPITPIIPFLTSLRKYKWDPAALYTTNSESAKLAYDALGWPADGFFAGNQWASSLNYLDPIFNSASGFADTYKTTTGRTPNYLDAASAISAFIMKDAIERADSLEPIDIITALKSTSLNETFFGPITFLPSGEVSLVGICEQIQPVSGSTNETERALYSVGPSQLAISDVIYPAYPIRPPPPPPLSYRQKLGLGLGLGLGIFALIIIIIIVVIVLQKFHILFLTKDGLSMGKDTW